MDLRGGGGGVASIPFVGAFLPPMATGSTKATMRVCNPVRQRLSLPEATLRVPRTLLRTLVLSFALDGRPKAPRAYLLPKSASGLCVGRETHAQVRVVLTGLNQLVLKLRDQHRIFISLINQGLQSSSGW